MANPEHLTILQQGDKVWNRWREDNPTIEPDLVQVDASENGLDGINFSKTKLTLGNFQGAYLEGANLSGAHLRGANLMYARLQRTDLSKAWLYSANLCKADLANADFNSTEIGNTIFGETDLSQALNLDSVRHYGPSYISTSTLALSKGNILEIFLRGCGLSDWEIEQARLYNPTLSNEELNMAQYRIHDLRVKQAIQIKPLFISYSHSNSDFVDAIEKKLAKEGVRYWRDIHDAKAGRLETQIDAAIEIQGIVLLILSKQSTKSDWVEHEARKARKKEQETRIDALCPVALDDSWKTCHWPKRLREQILEYNILDFSNWQDDAVFNKQFAKLLEGLNLFYK